MRGPSIPDTQAKRSDIGARRSDIDTKRSDIHTKHSDRGTKRSAHAPASPGMVRLARILTVAVFGAAAAYYILFSFHWKLMLDSAVMHYVVYLMQHGMRPYLEISDNNMPGAYFTEALAMRVFGPGDLAWRFYEYALLATMTISMILLARRSEWAAGVFGAGMFIALHSAEGPQYAGERELAVAALLLLSYLWLFAAVRRLSPLLLLPVGIAGGLAAAIKPTYLLFTLVLLLLMSWELRRRSVSPWPYLLWGLGGMLTVGLLCLGFLLRYHVLGGFLFILLKVLPTYAGFAAPSWGTMFRAALPRSVLLMALLTIPLVFANRRREGPPSWERRALVAGMLLALGSFLAQHKGFFHHRYAFVSLLFLLMGLEIFTALRATGWPRLLAAAVLLYALAGFAPRMVRAGSQVPGETQFARSLGSDLRTLRGAGNLDDKVQCFDLVYGCLNALYHEHIVENTGFTGDLLFFSPQESAARAYYRARFWSLAQRDPASVLVVSNQSPLEANSYSRIRYWPEFESYLASRYVLVAERTFPHERFMLYSATPRTPGEADSYRLYLYKGSPLLDRVPALISTKMPATISQP